MRYKLSTYKRYNNHTKPDRGEKEWKRARVLIHHQHREEFFTAEHAIDSQCTQVSYVIKHCQHECMKKIEMKSNNGEISEEIDNSKVERIDAKIDKL